MRSFKSNENIHKKEGGSYYVVSAEMHARKWLSNSSSVLAEIPIEDRKAEVDLDRSQLPCAKTLGEWWLADQDVFTFKDSATENSMSYTKRNFLKKIATLFDPIGFLAIFTIRAKMLLHDMWTAGMDWERRDVQVGEVVLVISPDTPRGKWPLGRVLEVYPRRRRTGTRYQGPGRAGHLDTISHEAEPFRSRDVNRASEKELYK